VREGDLLVINTSGALPAALSATRENDMPVEVHLSAHLPADLWLVELRMPADATRAASQPFTRLKLNKRLMWTSYDADSDTCTYVWKTEKGSASTCRQFVLTLNGGTQHVAHFRFK
jgi:S-adenosylmethionine:tRNA-ribosyltransferase-isomerase (queuine synthetase)